MNLKEIVHVVASSSADRAELARVAFGLGHHAEIYADQGELFRASPSTGIVLVQDAPDEPGAIALIEGMAARGLWCPVIVTAPVVDLPRVVSVVQAGAVDYLAPGIEEERLRNALVRAVAHRDGTGAERKEAVRARAQLAVLTAREIEVLDLLAAGSRNKEIARQLEISPRTVEIHRANMMTKLGANHAADAIRLRLATKRG